MFIMKFETLAVHAGQEPDAATGAVSVPIYQTSTFAFVNAGRPNRDTYSRVSNPTRTALETSLAALEHGRHGFAFSSGMAAETTVLDLLSAGDRVLLHKVLYGGTYRLFSMATAGRRYDLEYIDAGNPDELRSALAVPTKLVWIETPSNPLMTLIDIRETARIVHEAGALLLIDNTFLSPYFQNPLDMGADFVLHSVTKYINGHSDAIGGAVVVNDDGLGERIRFLQKSLGTGAQPFDSFLILRGIRTMAVRMREHNRNALALAEFLEKHPKVENVLHPGLASHPQHDLAARQMRGFGGTFSFRVRGGVPEVHRFLDGLRFFALAVSLGGVESLAEHPWSMTHASVPAELKLAAGITENLIRVSVGVEHIDDLLEDVSAALEKV